MTFKVGYKKREGGEGMCDLCVDIGNYSEDLGPGPRGNDLGDIRVVKKFLASPAIISWAIVTRWENLFSKLTCLSSLKQQQH